MSDDNVTSLALARVAKSQDNRDWTPLECLQDAVLDIENGKTPCDKLLVLRLKIKGKDGADIFDVGYNAAQLKASEILALLECAKASILKEMGYFE